MWKVKASTEPVGPGPNFFSDDPENVWVDAVGRLHLQITHRAGRWRAAEVILDHSLGHGRYRFSVASRIERLDSNVVLGLFTWSDNPDFSNREIDIEFGRWADAPSRNARYTVQPADRPGHGHAFVQPRGAPTTHEFRWTPGEVSFLSATTIGMTIKRWTYRGDDVPIAGDERTRINLWLQGGAPPTDGEATEVLVSRFAFTPHRPRTVHPPSHGALA